MLGERLESFSCHMCGLGRDTHPTYGPEKGASTMWQVSWYEEKKVSLLTWPTTVHSVTCIACSAACIAPPQLIACDSSDSSSSADLVIRKN